MDKKRIRKSSMQPEESEKQFKIDFTKDSYKRLHEEILNDITQMKTKKNEVYNKLEQNTKKFMQNQNNLVVRNEYLIKAFKNGDISKTQNGISQTKISNLFNDNEIQKVNLRQLNNLAAEENKYFQFYLEADQQSKLFGMSEHRKSEQRSPGTFEHANNLFMMSRVSKFNRITKMKLDLFSPDYDITKDESFKRKSSKISNLEQNKFRTSSSSLMRSKKASAFPVKEGLIIDNNATENSDPNSQNLFFYSRPSMKGPKLNWKKSKKGDQELTKSSQTAIVNQFSPQIEKQVRLSSQMQLQRIKKMVYNQRLMKMDQNQDEGVQGRGQSPQPQFSRFEPNTYEFNKVFDRLTPRHPSRYHRRIGSAAVGAAPQVEWQMAPQNLLNEQVQFMRAPTNMDLINQRRNKLAEYLKLNQQ